MSDDQLESGSLPDTITNRRRIIREIESQGISPKEALQALATELLYTTSVRSDDMKNDDIPEDAEKKVIETLVAFGVDPHNKDEIKKVREAAQTLKDLHS